MSEKTVSTKKRNRDEIDNDLSNCFVKEELLKSFCIRHENKHFCKNKHVHIFSISNSLNIIKECMSEYKKNIELSSNCFYKLYEKNIVDFLEKEKESRTPTEVFVLNFLIHIFQEYIKNNTISYYFKNHVKVPIKYKERTFWICIPLCNIDLKDDNQKLNLFEDFAITNKYFDFFRSIMNYVDVNLQDLMQGECHMIDVLSQKLKFTTDKETFGEKLHIIQQVNMQYNQEQLKECLILQKKIIKKFDIETSVLMEIDKQIQIFEKKYDNGQCALRDMEEKWVDIEDFIINLDGNEENEDVVIEKMKKRLSTLKNKIEGLKTKKNIEMLRVEESIKRSNGSYEDISEHIKTLEVKDDFLYFGEAMQNEICKNTNVEFEFMKKNLGMLWKAFEGEDARNKHHIAVFLKKVLTKLLQSKDCILETFGKFAKEINDVMEQ